MRRNQIESVSITAIGLFMHINGMSMISVLNSNANVLLPNGASVLVALSVLAMLTQFRPNWNSATVTNRSQHIGVWLLELLIILYVLELLMLQVWVPMLKFLNLMCDYATYFILTTNDDYFIYNTPAFAIWLRTEAFYYARFLLSLAIMSITFKSLRLWPEIKASMQKFCSRLCGRSGTVHLRRSDRYVYIGESSSEATDDALGNQQEPRMRTCRKSSARSRKVAMMLQHEGLSDYSC